MEKKPRFPFPPSVADKQTCIKTEAQQAERVVLVTFCCCDKIPWLKQSREERVYLGVCFQKGKERVHDGRAEIGQLELEAES